MSKLVYLEITDFMRIKGTVRFDFDESNILMLCGYNDSGKSAVTRSVEILFYNAYVNDQAKYINDDADFFVIKAVFDDGVSISREKYRDGQAVWNMLKGDKVIYTNRKSDSVIYAVSDIPEVIAKYLGVIEDDYTGEKLNVRRNTDRLFLINTTGGDNYKILNAVLRSDILAELSKQLNEDRNILQSDVVGLKTSHSTLLVELERIHVVDDSVVNELDDGAKNLADKKVRTESIMGILKQKQVLDEIVVFEEIPLIDIDKYYDISGIIESKKLVDKAIYSNVDYVDTDRYKAIKNIVEINKGCAVDLYPRCDLVGLEKYKDIKSVGDLFNIFLQINNAFVEKNKKCFEVQSKLREIAEKYGIKICDNCGAVVE